MNHVCMSESNVENCAADERAVSEKTCNAPPARKVKCNSECICFPYFHCSFQSDQISVQDSCGRILLLANSRVWTPFLVLGKLALC